MRAGEKLKDLALLLVFMDLIIYWPPVLKQHID